MVKRVWSIVPAHVPELVFCMLLDMALMLPRWTDKAVGLSGLAFSFVFFLALIYPACVAASTWIVKHLEGCPRAVSVDPKKVFYACLALMGVMYVCALLSNWPGLFSIDSHDIIKQAMGESARSSWLKYDGLSDHHPIAYTLLVRLFLLLTPICGLRGALGCFMLVQVVFVCVSCSWVASWLARRGAKLPYIVACVSFFAFSPLLWNYAITMWKDIPFSTVVMLLCIHLFDFYLLPEQTRGQLIAIPLLLAACVLLRSNGVLVALATIIYLLVCKRKQLVIRSAVCVVGVMAVRSLVCVALAVSPAHTAEKLAVPLQQLGAVAAAGEDMGAQESEAISRVISLETLASAYDPSTSNGIKFHEEFDDAYLEGHLDEFLLAWFRVGLKHPLTYVRAWVNTTRGYWEPCYGNDVFARRELFGEPCDNLLPFAFPLRGTQNALLKLRWFNSAGTLFWIHAVAVLLAFLASGRRWKSLIFFMPLFVLFASLMVASPTVGDLRYLFALFPTIPLLPFVVSCAAARRAEESQQRGEGEGVLYDRS